MYQFIRTLNNNAVLAKNREDQEVILLGKGIGFHHGKDEKDFTILANQVEKTFIPLSNQLTGAYLDLIGRVDEQILSASSEIILKASETLGELQPNIFVVLSAHIDFAIQRIRENIIIENPLMEEIELLYPKEFAVALESRRILEKRLHLSICREEAGYLALHFNSARYNYDIKDTLKRTNLLRSLAEHTVLWLDLPPLAGVPYKQLMDHFRGLLQRVGQDIPTENLFLPEIPSRIPKEYAVAQKLATLVESALGKKVSSSEIGYTAIHLHRLRRMV